MPSLRPPDRLVFVGEGDFERLGRALCDMLVRHGGLRPADDVLDIGCGVGRVAVPLGEYLLPTSRYEGFDIVRAGIDWCREAISEAHPNFGFLHVDLFNKRYNREGKLRASEFRFPYGDGSFDFAFATSVFTHLLPADLEHYVAEAERVLRPGGRLLATYFLFDDEVLARRAQWDRRNTFEHDHGVFRVNSDELQEGAIAYERDHALQMLRERGFELTALLPGRWSGRDPAVTYQDVVVALKPA